MHFVTGRFPRVLREECLLDLQHLLHPDGARHSQGHTEARGRADHLLPMGADYLPFHGAALQNTQLALADGTLVQRP